MDEDLIGLDLIVDLDAITEDNDPYMPSRFVPLNEFDYSWLPTPPTLWVKGIDIIVN